MATGLLTITASAEPTGALSTVYIKTQGDDTKSGANEAEAVLTFAKAKSLLAKDGTIYISMTNGYIANQGTETWSLGSDFGTAKIKVLPNTFTDNDFTGIFKPKRDSNSAITLTLENITLDFSDCTSSNGFSGKSLTALFDMTNKNANLVIGNGAMSGGYVLLKEPCEISAYDVVILMEGEVDVPEHTDAPRTPSEQMFDTFGLLKQYIDTYLRALTIEKLANKDANGWRDELARMVDEHIASFEQMG
jgi:DNA-binding IscR family transcriptional regulator